mgnify:CR=1 FL=1
MSSFDDMDAFEGASLSARAMAARPAPYLDDLNPAQREAVERLDGPVLMLACSLAQAASANALAPAPAINVLRFTTNSAQLRPRHLSLRHHHFQLR